MAAPSLEELFNDSRILQWDWTLLLLILYTPIGLILLVIRVFALIQFYLLFVYFPYHPIRKFVLTMFGSMMGVIVNEKRVAKVRVHSECTWVANHLSPFDKIVLQVLNCGGNSIIFPECSMTSGTRGLLKFQARVFEKQKQLNPKLMVQPIVLDVNRPVSLSVAVLGSSLIADTFFLFFTPWTTFNIRFLEPVSCDENEQMDTYIQRIETVMSEALGIPTTSFTVEDKDELIKRKLMESQQHQEHNRRSIQRRPGRNLEAMAAQVKEILPHVPMVTILRDLGRTDSVDTTVANLIEGLVPFIPETLPVATATGASCLAALESRASSSSAVVSAQMHISASCFGKSANERGLSLEERKRRLLVEARRRYCDKHGITNIDIPSC